MAVPNVNSRLHLTNLQLLYKIYFEPRIFLPTTASLDREVESFPSLEVRNKNILYLQGRIQEFRQGVIATFYVHCSMNQG